MNKRGAGIVAAIIGAILAIGGLIMGLVPFQALGTDCGSIFSGKSYGAFTFASAFADVSCERAASGRAGWVWTLIILGVLAVIVGVVLAVQRPKPEQEAAHRPSLSEVKQERAQEVAAADAAPARSVADELAALAALRDNGTLTPTEFEEAKRKALGTSDSVAGS